MSEEFVFEHFSTGTALQVDRSQGIIRGVKVIGFESKNGRSYPASTLKAAVPKYEGAKVNIDHPPASNPGQSRGVRDRFGVLNNARFVEGSGIHADLHYNPKHPLAEQVAWDAENQPNAIGLSHNARVIHGGRTAGGRAIVEAIDRVLSVDLVADPATTSGLHESVQGGPAQESSVESRKQRLLTAAGRGPSTVSEASKQRLLDCHNPKTLVLGERTLRDRN